MTDAMLVQRCSRHPAYTAKRAPSADCWPCRQLYAKAEERRKQGRIRKKYKDLMKKDKIEFHKARPHDCYECDGRWGGHHGTRGRTCDCCGRYVRGDSLG